MNEIIINQFNKRIDDLINLRTLFFTGAVTITGGLIGLNYAKVSVLNVCLLIVTISSSYQK